MTCKTANLIYLITCDKCQIQYVGLTETPLHKRMNSHRSKINEIYNNLYIKQHFSKEGHSFKEAHIQIIDRKLDHEDDNVLKCKEDFWINTLCTAYPLGLNDQIKGYGNISQGIKGNPYFIKTNIPRCRRGHGKKSKNNDSNNKEIMNVDEELDFLKDNMIINKNIFYKKLKSYPKNFLHRLGEICNNKNGYINKIINSFISNSTEKEEFSTQQQKKDREIILFPFISKAMDNIKLKSIFLDTKIQKLLPTKKHQIP